MNLRQLIKEEIQKILNEGYIDTFTRNLTKETLNIIKKFYTEYSDNQDEFDEDDNEYELGVYEINNRPIRVTVMPTVEKNIPNIKGFFISGAFHPGEYDNDYLNIYPHLNLDIKPNYEKIYLDVLTIIRHEIEHFLQSNKNHPSYKYREDPNKDREDTQGKSNYEYTLIPSELEANMRAAYLLAKKQRIPFKDAAFKLYNDTMELNNDETNKAVNILIDYIKKRKDIKINV
jgi:hypothetical protein